MGLQKYNQAKRSFGKVKVKAAKMRSHSRINLSPIRSATCNVKLILYIYFGNIEWYSAGKIQNGEISSIKNE